MIMSFTSFDLILWKLKLYFSNSQKIDDKATLKASKIFQYRIEHTTDKRSNSYCHCWQQPKQQMSNHYSISNV